MDLNKATKAEIIEILKKNQVVYGQELNQKQQEIMLKDKKIQELEDISLTLQSFKEEVINYQKKIQELEELKQQAVNNEQFAKNELQQLNTIDLKATINLKNDAIRNEHELRQENKKLLDKILQYEKEKEYVIIKCEEEKKANIIKYEEEIHTLKEELHTAQNNLQEAIDLKNNAIRNEHELRQENNALKNQVTAAEDNNKHIVKKINELASILEEYVTTFEEQQKILAIVLKNNNYIQSALKQKIEIFNKGE